MKKRHPLFVMPLCGIMTGSVKTLFLSVLNMSLTASYVILFIVLVRLLLKKAPKAISCALWSVAAFRLLCPLSFESMFSLLPADNVIIPQDIVHRQIPQLQEGLAVSQTYVSQTTSFPAAAVGTDPTLIFIEAGMYIWLLGIAALLVYSIVSVRLLKNRLKSAQYKGLNIYEADNLKTPFVLGLFKPKIFIPAGLTAEEKSYVIRHEQTHIRRFDHIIKLFAFLVLSVHWFNPLVWLAFVLFGTDLELACDERVIKEMGGEIKKAYSASLLSLASGKRILNGSPLAFGEGNVKGRIKNVLNYRKPAFWIVAAAVIAVIAIGIGLISDPRSDMPSMTWARFLRAEDIQSIELIVQPSDEQERYKKYEPEEYPEIIELVNQGRGKPVKNPEEISGGGQTFYITTKDGVIHQFLNNGNMYLFIDGDAYEAGYEWLRKWNYSGDSAVPRGFWDKVIVPLSVSDTPAAKAGEPEPSDENNITFTSAETELIKLGTIAFDTYMTALTSEATPAGERIASYQLNDISVLAGDRNEFCVALKYDFTTDSESYLNPARGAKGKGTWPDNYLEIRARHAGRDSYEIVSVGTGGGGQGLAPYAAQQTSLEPITAGWSPEQSIGVGMPELDYASDDRIIFHGYFGLFVYDLNSLQIIRSLALKPLKCDMIQGSDYCEVMVSKDGNTVQLHRMSSENMYVYTVSDNTLRETAYVPMSERFGSSFVPTGDVTDSDMLGEYSYYAVKFGKGEYGYLHVNDDGWTLDTLTYVHSDMVYSLFEIKE